MLTRLQIEHTQIEQTRVKGGKGFLKIFPMTIAQRVIVDTVIENKPNQTVR